VAHINPLGHASSFRGSFTQRAKQTAATVASTVATSFDATTRAVSAIQEERKKKSSRSREANYGDVLAMLEKHPKLKKPFTKRCVGRSYVHLVSVDTKKKVRSGVQSNLTNATTGDGATETAAAASQAADNAAAQRSSECYADEQKFDQYYVTISMDDADYEEKTQTVGSGYSYNHHKYTRTSANAGSGSAVESGKYSPSGEGDPDSIYFNNYFCLLARHYESKICISLHDAQTERRVGYAETSIFRIMQRDGDYYNSDWTQATYENLPMTDGRNGEKDELFSYAYGDTIASAGNNNNSSKSKRRSKFGNGNHQDDDGRGILM
jgi:hypothetical protein